MTTPKILPSDSSDDPENIAAMRPEVSRAEWDMIGYLCSHALRDPIRRIEIECEALANPELTAGISKETQHVNQCLSVMVDYMRMDIAPMKPKPVDVDRVIRDALKELEDKPYVQKATIEFSALPDVYGAKRRLIKLFAYLIDNACKFNDNDQPLVRVDVQEKDGVARFTMTDNGVGIPDMEHDLLFMLLTRPESSASYDGTGSGLALAKRIVILHGGQITIDNAPEEGAVVTFTLPLAELI